MRLNHLFTLKKGRDDLEDGDEEGSSDASSEEESESEEDSGVCTQNTDCLSFRSCLGHPFVF